MNIEQEKMIVEALPSLYPLKNFEEEAIHVVLNAIPHWIPVEQELPEDDTVVLVCGKSGGIYTAIHNNSKAWIRGWWKMNSKNHHCNPIAWMPLPEPYKGVTDDRD